MKEIIEDYAEEIKTGYYNYLLGLVKSGKIKPDPTLLYATIGDLVFFMIADTLPPLRTNHN